LQISMQRRERLERAIAGNTLDRVPVTLWRHFPGDDQRAADFARSIVSFQHHYDWDFAVVQPSSQFSVTGYGLQDEWRGNASGRRRILKRAIVRSLDWTELRVQDPLRGDMGRQFECLNLLGNTFESEGVPFVQVVYSPLAQAIRLAGLRPLLRNLRMHPDRVRSGLNILTESTLRFIDALRRTYIAGVVYMVELANYHHLTEAEYQTFGVPFDQKIIEAFPERWWLNVLHVRGNAPMLRLFSNYRTQVLHWEDQHARPELEQGLALFKGALCGGLSEQTHLLRGTPMEVRDAARRALAAVNGRRIILSAGRPIAVTTPLSNIQAVRDVVDSAVF
jgi:uroporphyrinogen decarboxylase